MAPNSLFLLERERTEKILVTDLHQKTAHIDGCYLSYKDYPKSDAPVLVFLHVLWGTKESYGLMIPHFLNHYRLLTLDLRGHGQSSKVGPYCFAQVVDDIRALLDSAGVEKASFIAASFSCTPIQMFAVKYPERVEKLVLLDGGFFRWADSPGFDLDSVLSNEELEIYRSKKELEKGIIASFKPFITEKFMDLVINEFELTSQGYVPKVDLRAFSSYFTEYATVSLADVYAKLQTPVLLLLADDNMRPHFIKKGLLPQYAERYIKKVRDATCIHIHNSHHQMMLTNAEEISRYIHLFLQSKPL